jgi:hypothetical protein
VFRIHYRADGKPMWSVPLTPFKGSKHREPLHSTGLGLIVLTN